MSTLRHDPEPSHPVPAEVKSLLTYIRGNKECESPWLYPSPQWFIMVEGLIDAITETWSLDRASVAAIIRDLEENREV